MERDQLDPLEAKAQALDLNYVKLDGEVGIIGNGAGLVMSTLDVVAYAGEKHRNEKGIGVRPATSLISRWRFGTGDGRRPSRSSSVIQR